MKNSAVIATSFGVRNAPRDAQVRLLASMYPAIPIDYIVEVVDNRLAHGGRYVEA